MSKFRMVLGGFIFWKITQIAGPEAGGTLTAVAFIIVVVAFLISLVNK